MFSLGFLLYLIAHLDRSSFLTLNIHRAVEYDQGSAKQDRFVTGEREQEGETVGAERD